MMDLLSTSQFETVSGPITGINIDDPGGDNADRIPGVAAAAVGNMLLPVIGFATGISLLIRGSSTILKYCFHVLDRRFNKV